MEVEVIQLYKGIETRKIIVWGSTGKDFRQIVSRFEIGKYYVMAFYKGNSDGYEKTN